MGMKSLPEQQPPWGVLLGGQCIVVQEAPGSKPGGPPFSETKKGAWELGLTMHLTSYSLTLTVHSPTKSNKGK